MEYRPWARRWPVRGERLFDSCLQVTYFLGGTTPPSIALPNSVSRTGEGKLKTARRGMGSCVGKKHPTACTKKLGLQIPGPVGEETQKEGSELWPLMDSPVPPYHSGIAVYPAAHSTVLEPRLSA